MRLTHHAIALFLLISFASPSRADTFVWTGAIDDRWSTPNNWQGGVSPGNPAVTTRTLVFPAGAAHTTMSNDLDPSIVIDQLRFEAPYSLSGPTRLRIVDRVDVTFSGPGKVYFHGIVELEPSGLFNTVTFDTTGDLEMLENTMTGPSTVTLRKEGTGTMFLRPHAANQLDGQVIVAEGTLDVQYSTSMGAMGATVLAGGTLRVLGSGLYSLPLRLAGPGIGDQGALYLPNGGTLTNVTLCCTADATINVGGGKTATIDGPIAGSMGLRKSGLGTLILAGATNTYAGRTTHTRGTLVLDKDGLVAVPNGLTIDLDTVRLGDQDAIQGTVIVNTWGVLDVNGYNETITALNGNGEARLLDGTLTVASPTEDSFFSGSISGSGGKLVRSGNASMRLSGVNSFTGPLTASGPGALRVDGLVTAPVALDGPLRGSGAIGPLTASGGIVEPGDGASPGILTTTLLSLGPGSSFAVKVSGDTAGTGYSQLRVTGTVSLGSPQLALSAGNAAVAAGTELRIIDNDGNDPVAGTFLNLPEGTIVSNNSRTFRLSYVGGTGNDVTLTALVAQYHLSEGATGAFFDTDLLIANPNAAAAPIEVQFLKPGGATVTRSYTVPGLSRMTIRVDDIAGLENTEVSTIVTSADAVPIVVERTMRWDATGYGAHTEKAVGGPSTTWYFAEGAQGFFSTYLLLANPNAQENTATVEYLREGAASIVRTYPLAPSSRYTVDVGADSDLVGHSFGMTVTFALAGVAERSMYFGQSPLWNAGHESAGATAPSTSWFLAEGATGPFFETFVLIANPNDAPTDVTITFLPDTGVPVTKMKTIDARSRKTVNIEAEDLALANAAVATRIAATLPVVVERAQYWPDPAPRWYEAHNSFGVTEPAVSWGLAEGRVGGPEGYQTYILLANPGEDKAAPVTLTFLREGKPSFTKTFTVNPTSRFTVSTGPDSLVPELQDERFGVQITAGEPIVVERAMYSNAGGVLWSAGTNATATRLP